MTTDLRKRVLFEVIDRYYDQLPIGGKMVLPYIHNREVYYFDVERLAKSEFEVTEQHGNPHNIYSKD